MARHGPRTPAAGHEPDPKPGRSPASDEGSVTRWIGDLRDGDELAAQQLWERYFVPLTRLARNLLPEVHRKTSDEEDVALSALGTLFDQLRAGRLPDLSDRDDLWRWLAVVTGRKALGRLRYALREKRGGRARHHAEVENLVSTLPPPEFEAIVSEEFQHLLDALGDDTLRQIALWKLDDVTNDEIAARLDCARRTVARKLSLIRKIWEIEVP